jgi:predicted GTPase
MSNLSNYNYLITSLRSLLGALEIASNSALYQDTVAICCHLERPSYRIAVFAPFNHGKSTLLNALLGSKTLPIDLIPTTGAGIIVSYGETLTTEIILQNGQTIKESGSKILSQYAVLDQDRRMKEEVAEVKVTCDHPWLKTGVELLDLPGTNDREAQNDLVKNQLLSADLVLHVLDARKLMTLEEREHLTHWLQNRGITNVVFVVNFLNLLTLEEQQQVRNRVCLIAESFRSDLPKGISNVYCVDALPALRARLKGNQAAAQETGLTTLESALQNMACQQNSQHKLPRVTKIAESLLEQATAKQQQLQHLIAATRAKSEEQIKVKQKASQLIVQGFNRSVADFRGWLYLPQLLTSYQPNLAIALQQTRFDQWLAEFQSDIAQHQQGINKWIKQGCEFFSLDNPQQLSIDCPPLPTRQIPEPIIDPQPEAVNPDSNISRELNHLLQGTIQGKVGAVVLGGASYILHKVAPKPSTNLQNTPTPLTKMSSQVYADAAAAYLKIFSDRANAQLTQYEKLAGKHIIFIPQTSLSQASANDYQLQLLSNLITNLKTELASM